jgi:hypothetical protein
LWSGRESAGFAVTLTERRRAPTFRALAPSDGAVPMLGAKSCK